MENILLHFLIHFINLDNSKKIFEFILIFILNILLNNLQYDMFFDNYDIFIIKILSISFFNF